MNTIPNVIVGESLSYLSYADILAKVNDSANFKITVEQQKVPRYNNLLEKSLIAKKFNKMTGIELESNMSYDENMKIYNELGIKFPRLIMTIGGLKTVYDLPVLDLGKKSGYTAYIDFLKPRDMIHPIMRGVDVYKRSFIAFCYCHESQPYVETFFQRYTDGDMWVPGGGLILSAGLNIVSGVSDAKNNMLDRLKKIIEGTDPKLSIMGQ